VFKKAEKLHQKMNLLHISHFITEKENSNYPKCTWKA